MRMTGEAQPVAVWDNFSPLDARSTLVVERWHHLPNQYMPPDASKDTLSAYRWSEYTYMASRQIPGAQDVAIQPLALAAVEPIGFSRPERIMHTLFGRNYGGFPDIRALSFNMGARDIQAKQIGAFLLYGLLTDQRWNQTSDVSLSGVNSFDDAAWDFLVGPEKNGNLALSVLRKRSGKELSRYQSNPPHREALVIQHAATLANEIAVRQRLPVYTEPAVIRHFR